MLRRKRNRVNSKNFIKYYCCTALYKNIFLLQTVCHLKIKRSNHQIAIFRNKTNITLL